MKKLTRLKLLDKFACTGSECPASCCSQAWAIDIDQATRGKWENIQDPEKRHSLLLSIEQSTAGNKKIAVVKRNRNGHCTHLTADKLCQIQTDLGHEFIPQTCQQYPRATIEREDELINSAHLSCPEIVRLVLEESTILLEVNKSDQQVSTNAESAEETVLQEVKRQLSHYIDIIIESRATPLYLRLYDIATILAYISRQASAGTLSASGLKKQWGGSRKALGNRLKKLNQLFCQGKLNRGKLDKGKINKNKTDTSLTWILIYKLYKQSAKQKSPLQQYSPQLNSSPLFNLLDQALAQDAIEQKSFKSLIVKSSKPLASALPGLEDHLCAYLKVKFLNHGFPQYPFAGNYGATFLDCVIPVMLSWLTLNVLAASGYTLQQEDLIKVLYSIERNLAHNMKIFEHIKNNPQLMDLERLGHCFLDWA